MTSSLTDEKPIKTVGDLREALRLSEDEETLDFDLLEANGQRRLLCCTHVFSTAGGRASGLALIPYDPGRVILGIDWKTEQRRLVEEAEQHKKVQAQMQQEWTRAKNRRMSWMEKSFIGRWILFGLRVIFRKGNQG